MDLTAAELGWMMGGALLVALAVSWRALLTGLASLQERCATWLHHSSGGRRNTDAPHIRIATLRLDEPSCAPQEIKRLKAVDADGRQYVVLEIVPLERRHTYHGIRVERGKTRYELNDGAPLTPHGDGTFEITETKVQLRVDG